MGPRPARPRDHPAGAGLRRGPRQEAARRTDPLDPRTHTLADAGTHTHTHTRAGQGAGRGCRGGGGTDG